MHHVLPSLRHKKKIVPLCAILVTGRKYTALTKQEKLFRQPPPRNTLQSTLPVFVKKFKVINDKERMKNLPDLRTLNRQTDLHMTFDPRFDLGKNKRIGLLRTFLE